MPRLWNRPKEIEMDRYSPEKFPLKLSKVDWQTVPLKISKASSTLAYYNGLLNSIPDPTIFLSSLETKEAVLSSRI